MTHAQNTPSWIQIYKKKPNARIRLFCFPYAGGGPLSYRQWADLFPEDIESVPILLPGRESRLRETPLTSIASTVKHLVPALKPYCNRPFAFFGHSMGGLISFELARELRRLEMPGPIHLFISAWRAPHIPDPDPPIHGLPDQEFKDQLRKLDGTPEVVLQNQEIFEIFRPALRADFTALEKYVYEPGHPLSCPITAFGGWEDGKAPYSSLMLWERYTTDVFKIKMFAGGHFFIHRVLEEVATHISDRLLSWDVKSRPAAAISR